MNPTGAAVLTGAGAVALGISIPWALLLALSVAIVAGGAGPIDTGVRIILRERQSDWLLQVWSTGNITHTQQMMPFNGRQLLNRFEDTYGELAASLPHVMPRSPKARDLATLRFLYQEDDPLRQRGYSIFINDPGLATAARAFDLLNGDALLLRFYRIISEVTPIRPTSGIPV